MKRLFSVLLLIAFLVGCSAPESARPPKPSRVPPGPNVPTETAAPTHTHPAPSETSVPGTPQPTVPAGEIEPFREAPECPTHDNTVWHPLWDSARGCHYDHQHGQNPALVADIFGEYNSISYPWLTLNENDEHGHPGYTNAAKRDIQPSQTGFGDGNYIPAFFIQYHDAGSNAHMLKRYHSFFARVQIQSRDGSVVGDLLTGGWADFGCITITYKEDAVDTPAFLEEAPYYNMPECGPPGTEGTIPYRSPSKLSQIANFWNNQTDNKWIWNSRVEVDPFQIFSFTFRTLDTPTGMSTQEIETGNAFTEHFLCDLNPSAPCKYNNSEHHVFTVIVRVPESLDFDGDGIVNFNGFTDRFGVVDGDCEVVSSSCVPLIINNAPVGLAYWRLVGGPRMTGDVICDHDIYFDSQGNWDQFCDDEVKPAGFVPSGWIEIHH